MEEIQQLNITSYIHLVELKAALKVPKTEILGRLKLIRIDWRN
jgi:hypothetical protein